MSDKRDKMAKVVHEFAAEFLGKENNSSSLITVTACTMSSDLKRGTILISVLPESKEKPALDFARRKLSDLRNFLKEKIRSRGIPHLQIKLDLGEKNRQRIDELLRKDG